MKLHVLEGKKQQMVALINEGRYFTWGNGEKPTEVADGKLGTFISVSTNGDTNAGVTNGGVIHLSGKPFFDNKNIFRMELDIKDKYIVGVKLFNSFMIVSTQREIHIIEKKHNFDIVNDNTAIIQKEDILFSYDLSTKPGFEKDTGQAEQFVAGDDFIAIMSVSTSDHTVKLLAYGNYSSTKKYSELTDILPEMSTTDFVAGKESVLQIGVSNNTLYALTTDGVLFLSNTITSFHSAKHPIAFKEIGDFTLCRPVFADDSSLVTGSVLINTRGIYFNQVDGNLYYMGFDAPIADPMEGDDEELQVMNYIERSFPENEKHDWKYYKLFKLNKSAVTSLVGNAAGTLTAVKDLDYNNLHTWGSRGNYRRKQYVLKVQEFQKNMYTEVICIGDTLFAFDMDNNLYSMGINHMYHILGYDTEPETNTMEFRQIEFPIKEEEEEMGKREDIKLKMSSTYGEFGHLKPGMDTMYEAIKNASLESDKVAVSVIDDQTGIESLAVQILSLTDAENVLLAIRNMIETGNSYVVFEGSGEDNKVNKFYLVNGCNTPARPHLVTDTIDAILEAKPQLVILIMNDLPLAFGNTDSEKESNFQIIKDYAMEKDILVITGYQPMKNVKIQASSMYGELGGKDTILPGGHTLPLQGKLVVTDNKGELLHENNHHVLTPTPEGHPTCQDIMFGVDINKVDDSVKVSFKNVPEPHLVITGEEGPTGEPKKTTLREFFEDPNRNRTKEETETVTSGVQVKYSNPNE